MNPLPDRIAAALSAYSQSVEDHTNASSVPSASKMLACLQGLTTAIAELAAERDRAVAECKLMEHKVITCGVAAHHPDANLTRTGAYAEKWDSPQAEDVRKLRAERDAARQELNELDIYLRCQGTQGESVLDRAKRIVANTSLPGYVRLVEERDAAVAKCAELERIAEQSRREGQEIAAGLHERIAELERMLRLLTSDLNGVNAELAATKAKLAGLLAAAKSASELVGAAGDGADRADWDRAGGGAHRAGGGVLPDHRGGDRGAAGTWGWIVTLPASGQKWLDTLESMRASIAELAAQRDGLLVAAKAVQELLGDDLDAPRIVDFRQACVRDLWDAFVEAIARAQPEQPQQPKEEP